MDAVEAVSRLSKEGALSALWLLAFGLEREVRKVVGNWYSLLVLVCLCYEP